MRNSISAISMRSNSTVYQWLPGQLARKIQWYVRDQKNLPKQLAEVFSDRYESEFRFIAPLDSWLHFNGDRWCLDYGLHLAAARRLCEEAAHALWNPHVDTLAMASEILRLASFNPKMTAPVEGRRAPHLERLLAGKGARNV